MTASFSSTQPTATATASMPTLTSHASHGSSSNVPPLVNKPSLIEYKNYRFLIHDAPTNANIESYLAVFKKRHVCCVVRACEATYSKDAILREGIKVVELPFSDGEAPPDGCIAEWLKLCRDVFDSDPTVNQPAPSNGHSSGQKSIDAAAAAETTNGTSPQHDAVTDSHKRTIAVHCVAGLGRAPVLVAIALIEHGLAPFDAIAFIRKKRRGAINTRQLRYIEAYKVKSKSGGQGGKGNKDCSIM